jgi:hypothetical protein
VLKKVGTYFSLRIVAGWIELLLFLRFKKCLQDKYKNKFEIIIGGKFFNKILGEWIMDSG